VLVGAVLTITYLMGPIGTVLGLSSSFARMKAALERIDGLGIDVRHVRDEKADVMYVSDPAVKYGVDICGVVFRYSGKDREAFTLGPINLTIRPGEITFVVGGNGSGKSTFLKLLTGLYVPTSGCIEYDGIPVTNKAARERYRQLFSAVFADYHLFKRLPMKAGRYAEGLNRSLENLLTRLGLEGKTSIVDGHFSTTDLSQGQRKRLALLAAYCEDRPVYVFDEWAADQDPQFKKVFYTEILPSLKKLGKAVVVVTHDDRYYACADKIVKLESGKLVATSNEAILSGL
jgi:putative ATP-binding cassette transporter